MNYAALLLPDFSLIFLGYCICQFTALNHHSWQAIEKVVYYVLFPALLFQSIVSHPIQWQSEYQLVIAGISLGLMAIALSYSLAYIPHLRRQFSSHDHAASAQIAFRFNSFIALAIAERLAGSQGLAQMAVLIGVCVPMFNMAAVWPMARSSQHGFVSELIRNPLIIATAAGLVASLVGLHIPSWAMPTLDRMGAAAIALGLMAAGAGLQMGLLRYNKTLSVSVLSIKHIMQPVMAMLISAWLGLTASQTTVLVAFSALPTASSCYVLAARMGHNASYVAGLVSLSTLLAILSLPFALEFLR